MQRYTIKNIALCGILLCAAAFSACTHKRKTPDVSKIPIAVKVARFDQDLYRVDTNQVMAGLQTLSKTYPGFLPTFIKDIMNFGPYSDSNKVLPAEVKSMLTNKDLILLQTAVDQHFAGMKTEEEQLSLAFKYTKYYIPSFQPPRVVAFTSAISNYGAVTVDSILGIGLDMYLGGDFGVYQQIPDLPNYMIRKFSKEYLVPDAVKALEQQLYPPQKTGSRLIAQMVDAGRQQYFLEMVLPGSADTIRTGYTKDQMAWCYDNEQMIWQYFVQRNLLYITDWQETTHYMGEGPSTQGMPPGSPGQIGIFIGWQIVRSYMDRHPETTLQQLMEMKDPVQIFNEAKYKPKS